MSFLVNVLDVLQQVAVLFILMGAGFAAGKCKWVDDMGIKQFSTLLFKIVTSCVIINSFLRVEFSASRMGEMLTSFCCCIFTVLLGALLSKLLFRNKKDPQTAILKFGTSFSNCGFMSLPLAEIILGDEGVFIVSVFVATFHMLIWTYGVSLFGGKCKDPKKVFLNPGIIGIAIGLPLFLLKARLPQVIAQPISSLAALNTPLAMVIVGFYLSKLKIGSQGGEGKIFLASAIRLVVCPLIVFAGLYLCGVRGTLLSACMIPACAPCAANTSIFAVMFGKDGIFASRLVGICTLLSIVTMPLIIAAAMAV